MIDSMQRKFNGAQTNLSKRFANSQRVRNLAFVSGRKVSINLTGDIAPVILKAK